MFLNENFDDMISTNSRTFCEGVDGLFEIALESEMSWNNIVNQAMVNEFNAIKNEDVQMLNEGVKDFFMKIIEWIKEKAKAVASFFKNLIQRIMLQAQNIEGFVKKHRNELDAVTGQTTAEAYVWKGTAASKGAEGISSDTVKIITELKARIGNFAKMGNAYGITADDISKELLNASFNEISTKYTEKYRNNEKKELTFNPNQVQLFARNLSNYKICVNEIKKQESEINKLLKEIETNAKQAVSDAKKLETGRDEAVEKNVAEKKKDITLKKELNSIYDRIVGTSISLCTQYASDGIKICKAAIKKPSTKKNESVSIFDLV